MESATGVVPWIRTYGWGIGRECGTYACCGTRSSSARRSCSFMLGGAGAQICGSGIWVSGSLLRDCQCGCQRAHNAQVLVTPDSEINHIGLLTTSQLGCPLGLAKHGGRLYIQSSSLMPWRTSRNCIARVVGSMELVSCCIDLGV